MHCHFPPTSTCVQLTGDRTLGVRQQKSRHPRGASRLRRLISPNFAHDPAQRLIAARLAGSVSAVGHANIINI